MPTKDSITTASIGDVFGQLTVIAYGVRDRHGRLLRVCQCYCGVVLPVFAGHLRDGHTRSCGCLELQSRQGRNANRAALAAARGRYHRGHPTTYSTWRAMIYRCENERYRDYPKYGGRGIYVCDRWRESFDAFLGDMGPRPPRMTIDRIDVNGNYEPGNCRWATSKVQSNNRRHHYRLTRSGVTKTLAEWAREAGLQAGTVRRRLRCGWDVDRALTEPVE